MSRLLIFIYGIISYAIGLGGLVCFILYVGAWDFLPIHIDSGVPGPLTTAILVNIGLMLLFGLQHTIMARPAFKDVWTKIIPKAAERSTYVLLTGILMIIFCLYWQPLNGVLWQVDNQIARNLLVGGYIIGWVLVVLSSFLINHFDLFGLQQVYFNLINKAEPEPYFAENFLYKIVRHPLQLGVLIGMWSAPVMSMTHFMLSLTMTIYIFIGLHYEEIDLVATLGGRYEDYRQRVRMIVPFPK